MCVPFTKAVVWKPYSVFVWSRAETVRVNDRSLNVINELMSLINKVLVNGSIIKNWKWKENGTVKYSRLKIENKNVNFKRTISADFKCSVLCVRSQMVRGIQRGGGGWGEEEGEEEF